MDGINAIFAVAAIYSSIVFGMTTTDIIMLGIGTNIAAGIRKLGIFVYRK